MNWKTWILLAVLSMSAGGCLGGGDDGDGNAAGGGPPPSPPPPPPPTGDSVGGLWIGELVSEVDDGIPGPIFTQRVRGLVAETGEFFWLLDDSNQQIFGTFEVEGADLGVEELPFWATGNPDNWGDFAPLGGKVNERVSLTGDFQSTWGWLEYVGTFSLAYDELYERDSSLEMLAGTYTSTSDTLTIDVEGVLFYQSSVDGCIGNGSVELIDPDFNMYRLAITVESCTGSEAARNGRTLPGLAYLSDSGDGAMNDVLEFASGITISEAGPFDETIHQHVWNLSVQR